MKQTTLLAPLFVLLTAAALPQAIAAPTIFFAENQAAAGTVAGTPVTERQRFLDALTNVSSEGFETFANGDTAPLNLTFTGSSSSLSATLSGDGRIYDTPGAGRYNTTPLGTNLWEVQGAFSIDFASTPISAFGFYGTDIGDFDGQVTIQLTDTADNVTNLTVNNTVNGADGSLLFWGFIDPNASYKSISFGNTAADTDVFGFDDMVIGDLQQIKPPGVPEPGTLALVGLSLIALSTLRRRRG